MLLIFHTNVIELINVPQRRVMPFNYHAGRVASDLYRGTSLFTLRTDYNRTYNAHAIAASN